MSRRFGRNQKRAMRNQLERLGAEVAQKAKDADLARSREIESERLLRSIIESLPAHSVFAPAVERKSAPIREFAPILPLPVRTLDQNIHAKAVVTIARLRKAEAELRNSIGGAIHMRFVEPLTGKYLGYAISEDAAQRLTKNAFQNYVWPEISEALRATVEMEIFGR